MARKLLPTRNAARRAIVEGRVQVAGTPNPRPATLVGDDDIIRVAPEATQYVSRGGEKLAGLLDRMGIDVSGKHAVDVGASTGGFTDCLLQRGTAGVVAIDVGSNQLHPRIAADDRVVSLEQTDVRDVDAAAAGGPFDLVVADVSFVSLRSVASAVAALGHAAADWIVLVKPQFEVGADGRDRRGVVADPGRRADGVAGALDALGSAGLRLRGFAPSSIAGGSGNVEYLAWLRRSDDLAHVTRGDDDGDHG